MRVYLIIVFIVSFPCLPQLVLAQNNGLLDPAAKSTRLIQVGLTTDRSVTHSADGAFTADVMAKSGLVTFLYPCHKNIARTISRWTEKYEMRLIENRSNKETLRLAYASENPSGYFVLDYRISEDLSDAYLDFSFRSLSNMKVPADEMGLEPLGQKLLEALQCVP